jgi:hypothetical protein
VADSRRPLLAVITLALILVGLGWIVTESFALMGIFGWAALFVATAGLGIKQLIDEREP